jgi:hypothetical protein
MTTQQAMLAPMAFGLTTMLRVFAPRNHGTPGPLLACWLILALLAILCPMLAMAQEQQRRRAWMDKMDKL